MRLGEGGVELVGEDEAGIRGRVMGHGSEGVLE